MDETRLTDIIESARQVGSDRERIEFVAAEKKLPKDFAETLASFANNTGGWVICGIAPEKGYVPVKGLSPRKIKKEVRLACKTLEPVLRPVVDVVPFEGSRVVVLRVDELRQREKPCHLAKRGAREGSYVRTSEGTVPMAAYEADLLSDEQGQPKHDNDAVKKSAPADLSETLTTAFLKRERVEHRKVFKGKSDKKALRALHVTRKSKGATRLTVAGLVALGRFPQRDFPRLCVMFTAFPGTDKSQRCMDGSKFLDARTITGPAPMMLDGALAAVRENAPELPLDAVREAVANAIMHRDYSTESRGYPVQLNLYADRLEVVSPGGLYGKATVGTLGRAKLTSSRNQFLCNILEDVTCADGRCVAENRGSGFVSMRSQMEQLGLSEPQVENSPESFTVTLRRPLGAAGAGAAQDGDRAAGSAGAHAAGDVRGGVARAGQAASGSGAQPMGAHYAAAVAGAQTAGAGAANGSGAASGAAKAKSSSTGAKPAKAASASSGARRNNGTGSRKHDVDGEIVAFLTEHDSASLKELREATGLGRTAVTNHVNALIKEGRVLATAPDRSPKQRYRLS